MLVRLVPAAVFKTVGLHGNHVVGGFDSHALPPIHYLLPIVAVRTTKAFGISGPSLAFAKSKFLDIDLRQLPPGWSFAKMADSI